MSRPDWVTCIARTHAAHKGESWCGRRIVMEFHFVSLDHAAENGAQQGGRMVACPQCLEAATKALRNGLESAPLPEPFLPRGRYLEYADSVDLYSAEQIRAYRAADAALLQQALDALQAIHDNDNRIEQPQMDEAIAALRERLG